MLKNTFNTLFLIIFASMSQPVLSHTIDTSQTTDSIIVCGHSYEAPAFIDGGTEGMNKFVLENIHAPSSLDYAGGSYIVQFEVDTLGNTQNIHILRGYSSVLNQEIIRVIGLLKFYPAKGNNKVIKTRMNLPICILLK